MALSGMSHVWLNNRFCKPGCPRDRWDVPNPEDFNDHDEVVRFRWIALVVDGIDNDDRYDARQTQRDKPNSELRHKLLSVVCLSMFGDDEPLTEILEKRGFDVGRVLSDRAPGIMTACMSCALGPGRFTSQSNLEYISLAFNTGRLSTAAHRTAAGAVVLTPAPSASGAAAPVMPPAPAWRGRSRFVQVPPSATSSQVEVGPWMGHRAQRQASLLLSRHHQGGLG